MFTTCAFCDARFPPNQAIEPLPLGRRLAFDERRGRAWVVCRGCERWNLIPTEERWEVIEACARAYRDERVRVHTGEIGLARLREGTELVRVGRPLLPEFAAWRYGDQFGRRRTRALVMGGAAAGGLALLAGGAVVAGVGVAAVLPIAQLVAFANVIAQSGLSQPAIDDPAGGRVLPFGSPRLIAAPEGEGGWGLDVPYVAHTLRGDRSLAMPNDRLPIGSLRLTGAPAQALLTRWATRLNRGGASAGEVRQGVELVAEAGGPVALAAWLARHRTRFTSRQVQGDSGELRYLPRDVRLALEISVHESRERALLAGELSALEVAWRRADEEAEIADALLRRPTIETRLAALRAGLIDR